MILLSSKSASSSRAASWSRCRSLTTGLQHAGLRPTTEPHVDRVPVAELLRQTAPGAALFRDIEQGIQDSTLGNRQLVPQRRQHRRQPFIPSIGQSHLVTKAAPPSPPLCQIQELL